MVVPLRRAPVPRATAALLAIAVASLSPALCAAGLLRHGCACATSGAACLCCEAEPPPGCDCEQGCSHDGCPADPCGEVLVGTRRSDLEPELLPGPLPLWAPAAAGGALPSRPRDASLLLAGPGARHFTKNLPFPPSEIPLLR